MPKIVLIAAPHSGAGKTTTTLALISALQKRGLKVLACKTGPDFIDTSLLAQVAQSSAWNLDSWMTYGTTGIQTSIQRALKQREKSGLGKPDCIVIEGAMGLFDGVPTETSFHSGSSADVALALNAPILLVANAKSMGQSIAALVHGCTTLNPKLNFAGIVLNHVASDNHKDILQKALELYTPTLPLLGMLPRRKEINIPARHLGLYNAQSGILTPELLAELGTWAENNLDIDALLETLPRYVPATTLPSAHSTKQHCSIAVANDQAFSFLYAENLYLLEELGVHIQYFSPLHDQKLPAGIQGLILPGGYPEAYLPVLSANTSLLEHIRKFALTNYPVYAEAGGYVYLSQSFTNTEGTFPLVDYFPFTVNLSDSSLSLGYRTLQSMHAALFTQGVEQNALRGHIFNYYTVTPHTENGAFFPAWQCWNRQHTSTQGKDGGMLQQNTMGSTMYCHFASAPQVLSHFIDACSQQKPLNF